VSAPYRRVDPTRDACENRRGSTRFTLACRVWAAERVLAGSPPPPPQPDAPSVYDLDYDRVAWGAYWEARQEWERSAPVHKALREVARCLDVSRANVLRWVGDFLWDGGAADLVSDEQRAELDQWERLRPHRDALRSMLAFADAVDDTPRHGGMRAAIERVTDALDAEAAATLRPAIDAFLMAADLAVEVDRLVENATALARGAYEARKSGLEDVAAPVAAALREAA